MSNHGASLEDLSRMTLLGQPFANDGKQNDGQRYDMNNGDTQRSSADGNVQDEGEVIKRADSGLYFEDNEESDSVDQEDFSTPSAEARATRQVSNADVRAASGAANVLKHRIRERISDWKGIALTQLKFQMDEQAIKVSELKEGYVHSRKSLVSKIRVYTNR